MRFEGASYPVSGDQISAIEVGLSMNVWYGCAARTDESVMFGTVIDLMSRVEEMR